MKVLVLLAGGIFVASAMLADSAAAQMFGPRALGGTLSQRASPGAESAGTLTGSERFLRGNRSRGDFVGADAREQAGFVGRVRARTSGPFRSATSGFRIQSAPSATRSAPSVSARRTPMYEPRLTVGFTVPSPPQRELADTLARQLEQTDAIKSLGPIEVSVEGQTAILRGEVASEHDAVLAGLLVRFEPGVQGVRNELRVAGSPPPDSPPAPPAAPATAR